MINLRLPNITAQTEKGQLEQIRSYLYQFAEQLNWALNNIDNKAAEATQKIEATTQQKDAVEQAHATFSEVKSLIIKSADIVNAYYEEINHRLEGVYVAEATFPEGSAKFVEQTALTLEANSKDVKLLFNNNQAIITDMEGLTDSVNQATSLVEGMDGRVSSVEGSVSDMSNTVAGMDGRVTTVEGSVVGVEESLGGLTDRVGEVSSDVTKLGVDLRKELDEDISSVSGKVANLEEGMSGVNDTLGTLSTDVDAMDKNLESVNRGLEVGENYTKVVSTQAWCKIGLLSEGDETPIYGMEIGQVDAHGGETDKRIAQYRSDGVYLYDESGIEVAKISKLTLIITNAKMVNAEVTNKLTVGGYEVTTSNGLTFKWQGRG